MEYPIANAVRSQFNWTQYRSLIQIDDKDKREYYELEAAKNNWTARDLYKILEYNEYRNFLPAARKAWTACRESGFNPNDHFVPFNDMVSIGSGAERQIDNIKMSRYACYLAAQNADPSKSIVAQAQTYFAVQTRRAEVLLDNAPLTEEEQRRLLLRSEMKKHRGFSRPSPTVPSRKPQAILEHAQLVCLRVKPPSPPKHPPLIIMSYILMKSSDSLRTKILPKVLILKDPNPSVAANAASQRGAS